MEEQAFKEENTVHITVPLTFSLNLGLGQAGGQIIFLSVCLFVCFFKIRSHCVNLLDLECRPGSFELTKISLSLLLLSGYWN